MLLKRKNRKNDNNRVVWIYRNEEIWSFRLWQIVMQSEYSIAAQRRIELSSVAIWFLSETQPIFSAWPVDEYYQLFGFLSTRKAQNTNHNLADRRERHANLSTIINKMSNIPYFRLVSSMCNVMHIMCNRGAEDGERLAAVCAISSTITIYNYVF